MKRFLNLFGRTKPRTRRSKFSFAGEALEVRCVLTNASGGTVTAFFDGYSLYLYGDKNSNSVQIDVSSTGVAITGTAQEPNTDATTIKPLGVALPTTNFTGLPGGIYVFLYEGNDHLDVTSSFAVHVGGSVYADLGSGNDTATFSGAADIAGGLTVLGGTGTDTVSIADNGLHLHVGGSILIDLGPGVAPTQDSPNIQSATIDATSPGSVTVGGGIFLFGSHESTDHLGVNANGGSIDVTGSIYECGFGGNDTLGASTNGTAKLTVGGIIAAFGGSGNDTININGDPTAVGKIGTTNTPAAKTISALGFYAFGSAGDDTVAATGLTTKYDFFVSAGAGNDNVGAANVSVGSNLYVFGRAGNDRIGADAVHVAGNTILDAGAGDDTVGVNNSKFSGYVFVDLGSGNDQFAAGGSLDAVDPKKVYLDGGSGTDKINPSRQSLTDAGAHVTNFEGDLDQTAVAAIIAAFKTAFTPAP